MQRNVLRNSRHRKYIPPVTIHSNYAVFSQPVIHAVLFLLLFVCVVSSSVALQLLIFTLQLLALSLKLYHEITLKSQPVIL